MNSRKRNTIIVSVVVVVLLLIAMATSGSEGGFLAKDGIWSILPPLVAITLAFVTQNVVISLLMGVMVGTFLISMDGFNLLFSIQNSFIMSTEIMLGSLADSWNAGILLQVLAIGGLIALITKLGGAKAIAEGLAKRARGPVSAQVVTWIMGIIVFFDDYANSLIVGPIMRPVTDKNLVSREKLSFIVDATAAPVAGIALISTWVGYEISCIRDGLDLAGITDVSPYNLFVVTIPYRFYNILMLVFVVLTAVMMKEFGPMLGAENRARGGNPLTEKGYSNKDEAIEYVAEDSSIWSAIIPLGVLIVGSFLGFYLNGRAAILGGEDAGLISLVTGSFSFKVLQECFGNADASIVLFQAALLACFVAFGMGIITKKFDMEEGVNVWLSGVKSLIITGVILLLAWSLSSTIGELGTAAFIVKALAGVIPKFVVPALIFILASIISFATGTSYGTMGILLPLAIPFAARISPSDQQYLIACSSAVLTGAIFGDHCSPISDTTILSSMGADCDHIAHVNTQLPYSLAVAAIAAVVCYIPVGLGLSVWIALPIGIAACAAVLLVFGKNPSAGQ